MAGLERVQILLEGTQRRALARLARREGRSVSDILREMIRRSLAERKREELAWKDALAHLHQIRQAHASRGVYAGDLVAEARADREREIESIWHPSS
jgi:hypothetical protein